MGSSCVRKSVRLSGNEPINHSGANCMTMLCIPSPVVPRLWVVLLQMFSSMPACVTLLVTDQTLAVMLIELQAQLL